MGQFTRGYVTVGFRVAGDGKTQGGLSGDPQSPVIPFPDAEDVHLSQQGSHMQVDIPYMKHMEFSQHVKTWLSSTYQLVLLCEIILQLDFQKGKRTAHCIDVFGLNPPFCLLCFVNYIPVNPMP